MATIRIKDEALVGSEARVQLKPSAYLQKLYQTGTPDLGWMGETGQWGMRAEPGNLGLRLADIQIGSYGEVTSDRAYKADDHGKDTFGESPEVGGGYYTYDYGTGESGIITPRLGGGFQIDRY